MTVTPRTSSMIAPEIGGVRDPVYLPSDKALELISNLDSVLAEKDHTIAALTMQHEDDLTTLTLQHEEAMAAMQDKYNALYFHCTSMAKDIRRKDTMLDCLKDADRAHRDLCAAQQELARSTMALAKNHRTKFVSDRHQLVYRSTESTPEVKQEMSLANKRLRAEKAKQERASMARLSNTVDQLAKKYDRYNLISHTNVLNTRCDPDGLPCLVPREMMGLWLYADNMEPTVEELAMYEFHLQKEVRGPPIYSPTLPRPTLNWTNLNKHRRKNLPDPEQFPVHSVPLDPTYYLDKTKYKPVEMHNNGQDEMTSERIVFGKDCGCAKCVPPFGHKYGLMSDMGVIAMPESAVHGYRWDDAMAGWVIATGC